MLWLLFGAIYFLFDHTSVPSAERDMALILLGAIVVIAAVWQAVGLGVARIHMLSLKIARSDTQERSYCTSVDSGKGTGRCRVYLSKEETLMPELYDERIVETAVQARQGVTGHNVRYVLAFSTCGVIAAFV